LSRKDISGKSVVQHIEEEEDEDNTMPGPGSYNMFEKSTF